MIEGKKTIFVTGGAGFIGSALIRHLISRSEVFVVNLDNLTYAGNLENLSSVEKSDRYAFEKVDICEHSAVTALFEKYKPHAVVHLAAESHVDRSIDGPGEFIRTNIVGTSTLLEVSRRFWGNLETTDSQDFRFLHVSTDEVYGDLELDAIGFTEETPYKPSSPYSASKASSDHLVRAWNRTYGLPVLITNCSNNYGPFQFPEKLIPVVIFNALEGRPIPVYGSGNQIRDWLFVEDHASAIWTVLNGGKSGETYNIGGHNEIRNIDVVKMICSLLEEMAPEKPEGISNYEDLISYVTDRPGHDFRYAIDASKIERKLGWKPEQTFETGLRQTVEWYLSNKDWRDRIKDGTYRNRIGLGGSQI